MAAGRPVVATNVGGVSEIISSGENGLIVPPQNAEALSEALFSLLDNPARAQTIAERGRQTVETHFNVKKMMERYRLLYESVNRQGYTI